VIPAIDIREGRCVRLYKGDYAQEKVYAHDPVSVALRFQEWGARRLHVVDLDGAREGRPVNVQAVASILKASQVPVQVGGGLRTLEAIRLYLGLGADVCVLGTMALEDESLLSKALAAFPGHIAVAVDVREGHPLARGWTSRGEGSVLSLLFHLIKLGVTHIIYTDTSVDGTLQRPRLEEVATIVTHVRSQGWTGRFIYAGGIACLDDLLGLTRLGLDGAIVGRALYEGKLDLKEAIAAVALA